MIKTLVKKSCVLILLLFIPLHGEKTFAIIKPDAVETGYSGKIIEMIELNNFSINRMEKLTLTRKKAKRFYCAHKGKPFFNDLIDFMTSGPSIILVLEKDNAIQDWRTLMGTTDPNKANPGTLRYMFGSSITKNATHGSDATKTAREEIGLFYPELAKKT